ncbi:hypothetical protein [Yoonia sediminilitoris]|uniref:Secreted protein n=1 Tax=Yoonia sediminilitoris TaxID=1286148 RepID=A0A2T6KHD5_9RHOB|nr:hypothetical protein [Yoonia sediminilitoris]PUB14913.1 hypothetical protein C8N45_105136 [Yoonia sediminilitoris]RCW95630.1 hypothetical protein DFP92_105136 [Yoonia sediminilitoris]
MFRHFRCLGLVSLATLIASAATAAPLELSISVLDAESFELGPPAGDTRWVIEGDGDFLLAEQHGAMSSMRFDLPAGQYRVTVWELDSNAAAEQRLTLPEGGTAQAALTLSPSNKSLIAAVLARTREPEAKSDVASNDQQPDTQGTLAPLTLGLAARPGTVFAVTLPQVPDAANDRVALSDGGDGWIWSSERGSLDEMAITAPQTPGDYTVQYVQVPEMAVLQEMKVRIR